MVLFHWIAGSILAVIWLSRLIETILGLPRLKDISPPAWLRPLDPVPRVTVIVPARNEAQDIEQCLTSLARLDYPAFEVIAVNDRSTDPTGAIMDRLAAAHPSLFRVLHVTALPEGWLGKTHAMWLAGQQAKGDILLFTDGDVWFRSDSVRRAVSFMVESNADHVVLFPTMVFKRRGEKMMLGFFHAALSLFHRHWKVSDPKARDHVGVGAFNMIRRVAYEAIGTYAALRTEVIDDLRLGRLVKDHAFRQAVALGPGLVKIHWATGALGIVRAVAKNSFAMLHFSWLLVFGASLGIAIVALGPLAGLILGPGWTRLPYACALAAMAAFYFLVGRFTGISPGYFFLHPVAACLTIYALWRSAWQTSRHGVVWRGTSYPLAQFRK